MKKNLFCLISCLLLVIVNAQTPQYYNLNTGGANNSFPFNSATTGKVQWTIPANSLGSVGPGNNITVVHFQASNNSNQTYPILNIKLKTGTSAGLVGTGSLFETGMTTVYSGVNVNVVSTTGGWVSFTLTTPFLYDPSLPLLVEGEQNATTGTGFWVTQSTHPGPGNGRQYGAYNQPNFTASGAQLVHFGIDVIPATPCTGPPPSNTLNITNYTTCPSIPNPTLSLVNTYSLGGLTYQWMQSTSTQFGPFTPITNATLSSINVPTLSATTWYQLVATCTNVANASTTISPSEIYVNTLNTTNTVPYFEDFEGIAFANRLPNCSWYSTNNGGGTKTYVAAGLNNLVAKSGSKFASFSNSTPGTNYYYTNQIWMDPGVTYSASMWYQTDLTGATNWSNLSMLLGTSQSTAGLVQIASTGPAVSPVYKSLSNLFTVSTSGYYHIAIRATGAAGTAQNLSWDDLSVTIPCNVSTNSPTVTLSQGSSTVCQGALLSVTAAGATSYTWSDGSNGTQFVDYPFSSTSYVVTGINQLTGCTATAAVNVKVNPAPSVNAIAVPAAVCKGKPVTLMAGGATTYAWSSGGFGSVVTTVPTNGTMYSVIGTGTNNCTATANVSVAVLNLPNVTAIASPQQLCVGEPLSLTANGATSYEWIATNTSNLMFGGQITVFPNAPGSYTVTGKDNSGCTNTAFVAINADACTALSEIQLAGDIQVYPNPHNGEFAVNAGSGNIESIIVTDIAGRKLLELTPAGSTTIVNLSEFSGGIYYVTINTETGRSVVKTVKK